MIRLNRSQVVTVLGSFREIALIVEAGLNVTGHDFDLFVHVRLARKLLVTLLGNAKAADTPMSCHVRLLLIKEIFPLLEGAYGLSRIPAVYRWALDGPWMNSGWALDACMKACSLSHCTAEPCSFHGQKPFTSKAVSPAPQFTGTCELHLPRDSSSLACRLSNKQVKSSRLAGSSGA